MSFGGSNGTLCDHSQLHAFQWPLSNAFRFVAGRPDASSLVMCQHLKIWRMTHEKFGLQEECARRRWRRQQLRARMECLSSGDKMRAARHKNNKQLFIQICYARNKAGSFFARIFHLASGSEWRIPLQPRACEREKERKSRNEWAAGVWNSYV